MDDSSNAANALLFRMNLLNLSQRSPSLIQEALRCFKKREYLTIILAAGRAEELLRCLRNCSSSTSPIPKISLQVAYNVAAVDSSNSEFLWNVFKSGLAAHIVNEECSEAACLIVHVCCRHGAVSVEDPDLKPIFQALLCSKADDALLAIESIVLIPQVYESIDVLSRIAALHSLNALHSELRNSEPDPAVCSLLETISRRFDLLVSSTALNLRKEAPNAEPENIEELLIMLEFLGTMAASDAYRSCLQEKPFVVVSASGFLRAFHDHDQLEAVPEALKEPPVENMSTISQVRSGVPIQGVTDSPSFEVKQKLVKLVGNLAFRHKPAQDLIRESGGLPALLNSCRMDARNPYLMQWAILAIRNVCEGNSENQKLVQSLKSEGLAPGARSTLDQFSSDGDKLEAAVLRISKS